MRVVADMCREGKEMGELPLAFLQRPDKIHKIMVPTQYCGIFITHLPAFTGCGSE